MSFQKLVEWSHKEFPELPWRKKRSLYRTLVSEIMLQQTTVSTVKNHFERFLLTYPNLKSLTETTESDLLIAWKGLGYYRRAKNLKKIADNLMIEFKGKFPKDKDLLMKISGIGPYTANAILSIGHDERALALDANLERVIARLYGINLAKGPKLHQEIERLFEEGAIFKNFKGSFRELNEALMDLGRTYCQARKVSCELCPLRKDCESFKKGNPLSLPLNRDELKKEKFDLKLLRVLIKEKNSLYIYHKEEGEWLSGQSELPTFIISTDDPKCQQYPVLKSSISMDNLAFYKTSITKYKITNYILEMTLKDFQKLKFPKPLVKKSLKDKDLNLSTASLKALKSTT